MSANDHPSAAVEVATVVEVSIGNAKMPRIRVMIALRDIQGWNTPNGPDKDDLMTAVHDVLVDQMKVRIVKSKATLDALKVLKGMATTTMVNSRTAPAAPAAPARAGRSGRSRTR